eukprot:15470159-Alexandrium_andersonii.AAC.1
MQQHRQMQQQTQRGNCTRGSRLAGLHAERAPDEVGPQIPWQCRSTAALTVPRSAALEGGPPGPTIGKTGY